MSFECGRLEKCKPCMNMQGKYADITCSVVASVVQRPDITEESSLAAIRDAVWTGFEQVDPTTVITPRLKSGAFASAVQLIDP